MARSILVIDDDHAITEVLTVLLGDEGFLVRSMQEGAAALHEIARAPPDLIVSDVSMPFIDGIMLTKNLRARGIEIPVVLVSAVTHGVDLEGIIFLTKPFDLDHLLEIIRQLLDDTG